VDSSLISPDTAVPSVSIVVDSEHVTDDHDQENDITDSLIEQQADVSVTHAEQTATSLESNVANISSLDSSSTTADTEADNIQVANTTEDIPQSSDDLVKPVDSADETELNNELLLLQEVSLEASQQRQQWWSTSGDALNNDLTDSVPVPYPGEVSLTTDETSLQASADDQNVQLVQNGDVLVEGDNSISYQASFGENSEPVITNDHIQTLEIVTTSEPSESTTESLTNESMKILPDHQTSPKSPSEEATAEDAEKKPLIDVAVIAHA